MEALVILVPAAGRSARMGSSDKLLMPVCGEALLRRQVRAALAVDLPVLVTLPQGHAEPRSAVLAGLDGPLEIFEVAGERGMSASLNAGAAWATQRAAKGLMVVLPDMPEIGPDDIATLASAAAKAPEQCWRACSESGEPGHPVVLPARLFAALADLQGDTGARPLLAGETVATVPLPGQRAIIDLDTPEAWSGWRSRQLPQASAPSAPPTRITRA